MSPTSKQTFVVIASMAAELHSVLEVAWGVSLAAKNAKIISTQAGDIARGFHPITKFIDQISVQAMSGVRDIDERALALTHITVAEERAIDAQRRFASVFKEHPKAKFISSLSPAMHKVDDGLEDIRRDFKGHMHSLDSLLEELDECMLSARSVASVSKIVTANTGDYKEKLLNVSRTLENAAKFIKEKTTNSHYLLNSLSF
jgi:hypothetical protein